MSSPTNLTDNLSRLRERKGGSNIGNNECPKSTLPKGQKKPKRERRFATDTFMIFAYTLLGIATVSQLILIVLLDVI